MTTRAAVSSHPSLTEIAAASRILRDALRDRSYQSETPLGAVVRRYLRWKNTEWGATQATLRDYEIPLAYLCLFYPRHEITEFQGRAGTELVREFWDHHWSHRAARTRAKNLSILRDFFRWCVVEDIIQNDPTFAITRPRKRGVERGVIPPEHVVRIVESAARERDRAALSILFAYGLRKSELAAIQLRHYDQRRGLLRIKGKGEKIRELPVSIPALRATMDTHWAHRLAEGKRDEYLLYPEKHGPSNNPDRERIVKVWEDRLSPLSGTAMHRWWKWRLSEAGVPDYKMHEARHTVITDFVRETGNLELARMLAGHSSIKTTADVYSHLDTADLDAAMMRADASRVDRARGEE